MFKDERTTTQHGLKCFFDWHFEIIRHKTQHLNVADVIWPVMLINAVVRTLQKEQNYVEGTSLKHY